MFQLASFQHDRRQHEGFLKRRWRKEWFDELAAEREKEDRRRQEAQDAALLALSDEENE